MSSILIVEDHAMSRRMLKIILAHAGHHVIEAADGSAALTLARSQNPDLIISDIAMPTMDGFEFVRLLRSEEKSGTTPVIFYTATYRTPDAGPLLKSCPQCRILPKPSAPSHILKTISEMLGDPFPETMSHPVVVSPFPVPAQPDSLQGAGLQLATLIDLSYHLVGQRDPLRLLHSYCRAAREIAQCKNIFLSLVDKGQTRFYSEHDGIKPSEVGTILPLAEIQDQVFVRRGIYRSCYQRPEPADDGHKAPCESLLAIPFSTANRVYGWTCFVEKKNGSPFTDEDEELNVALNSQAALAYENLLITEENQKTHEELAQRVRELEEVVAERTRIEEELRKTTGLFRLAFSEAPAGMCIIGDHGRFILVNKRLSQIVGYDERDLLTMQFSELASPGETIADPDWFQRPPANATPFFEIKTRCVRRDGRITEVLLHGALMHLPSSLPQIIMHVVDITEQAHMEAALKDSEKKYRSLVDQALVGVFQSDLEGRFLYVNDTMAKILEYPSSEDALSQNILSRTRISHGQELFIEKLKQEESLHNCELELPAKTGGFKHVLVGAAISGGAISGMMLDITERKELEEQLRQAQKFEAVGQLAGGIAHDYNNILSAIIGYGNLIRMKMAQGDPSRHIIEQILESADRAASLTHNLLAFSRRQILIPRALSVNDIVRKTVALLQRTLGEDIEITTAFKGTDLFSVIDGGQMEQVFMNLATNARDAMPKGGRLSLSVEPAEIDDAFVTGHGYGEPGPYVLISVTDTGIGMDDETRERIFEPFFTTKELGKGSGLGLAMVYGIVKQHNGFITVTSKRCSGTTFKIYLRRIVAKLDEEHGGSDHFEPQGGNETILIAEDDRQLRSLMEMVLKEFGYTVISTQDGTEAIQQFDRHKEGIQLAILDMIMPKMNGRETYEAINKIKPGIKTIIQTGYAEDRILQEGGYQEDLDFLLKPISPRELLRKTREVLDR